MKPTLEQCSSDQLLNLNPVFYTNTTCAISVHLQLCLPPPPPHLPEGHSQKALQIRWPEFRIIWTVVSPWWMVCIRCNKESCWHQLTHSDEGLDKNAFALLPFNKHQEPWLNAALSALQHSMQPHKLSKTQKIPFPEPRKITYIHKMTFNCCFPFFFSLKFWCDN